VFTTFLCDCAVTIVQATPAGLAILPPWNCLFPSIGQQDVWEDLKVHKAAGHDWYIHDDVHDAKRDLLSCWGFNHFHLSLESGIGAMTEKHLLDGLK
jgi:hypothetical protein